MSQRPPLPGPGTALVVSLALGLLAAPASAADEAPGPGELDDLGQMSLEDLLNADVVTVTKSGNAHPRPRRSSPSSPETRSGREGMARWPRR